MKLFDAIKQSPVKMAFREEGTVEHPNVVLVENGFVDPKAFQANDHFAWERRKLSVAKTFDDWKPAKYRRWPFEESEIIDRLGGLADA